MAPHSAAARRLVRRRFDGRSGWSRVLRILCVGTALGAVALELTAAYYDQRLSAVAQEISGHDEYNVRCRRVWDNLRQFRTSPGYVVWGSDTAQLQLDVCFNAAAFGRNPTGDNARVGMMILTHEVAHLVGHHDESETECVAMWAAPRTAQALGRTHDEGEAAARWYAVNRNPRLRADYRAPGCLAGSPPTSPLLR
ncbi:MAG: hypothetical protein AAGD35_09475 [Actinomycetota bacterium]